MTYKTDITQDFLKSILDYNPDTGIFTWKSRLPEMFKNDKHDSLHNCRKWNARYAGINAGSLNDRGYLEIGIGISKRRYRAHILAWVYIYGEWPSDGIDHIDGDKTNNSINNLRMANQSQNAANSKTPKTNKSGYKGVYYDAWGDRYRAKIVLKGKRIYLGSFDLPEEAYQAYCRAAQKIFGEFARLK